MANITTVVSWRWAAIELLRDRTFNAKSDVWSFGVKLWEILTLAAKPFVDIGMFAVLGWTFLLTVCAGSMNKLLQALSSGQRLEKPEGWASDIFQLMRTCWDAMPERRPVCSRLAVF